MYGEVISTRVLTPQLVRVVLGGGGLDAFEPVPFTDAYVNCLFLPEAAPYDVPFADDAVRELPREQRPRPRRITVSGWDPERRELTVDIATHGAVGHAGRWVLGARPGDRLQFRGPAGDYVPPADVDGYVFVGDESALPAICASVQAVPAGRPVVVVAEVEDPAGELPVDSPGDLTLRWVHRAGHAEQTELLADAVASLAPPAGTLSAFVHGEAASIRAVRRVLLREWRVDLAHLSCSPYWHRGLDDEQWRQIKGDWVKSMRAETFEAGDLSGRTT